MFPVGAHCVAVPVHWTQPSFTQYGVLPLHVVPHAPQLPFIVSSTHTLLQIESEVTVHAGTQVVPLQAAVPPVGAAAAQLAQDAPHALSSLATQAPPQTWFGAAHWQELLTQCSPLGHCMPQVAQLWSSLVTSTHEPLHSMGAVEGHPVVHACPGLPVDGAQTGVPEGQLTPHAPQLGLTDRSVAQPAPASAQSAWPAAHWYEQWPDEQVRPDALTFGSFVQSCPHAPQL